MKYLIRSNYSSDDDGFTFSETKFKHSIVETYECQTFDEMKNILAEMLDCFKDYDNNVVEPTLEVVKDKLYDLMNDEELIKNEAKKYAAVYIAYNKMLEMLDKDATYATVNVPEMNSNFEVMCNKGIK